jgi:hypothetical protein
VEKEDKRIRRKEEEVRDEQSGLRTEGNKT